MVLPTGGLDEPRTIALPPAWTELDVPTCEPTRCPSFAAGDDGWLVVYDPRTRTFTFPTGGPPGAPTVAVEADLDPVRTSLVAVGPEQVAYLLTQSPTTDDPDGELVAVSLHGRDAGRVLARSDQRVDTSGDTDVVATREGLVAVGCCGTDDLRPDPAQAPLMRWVGRDGRIVVHEAPQVRIEVHDGTFDVVLTDGIVEEARWVAPVPAPAGLRGMPRTSAVDGAVLVGYHDVIAGAPVLLRLDASGATMISPPPGTSIVAFGPYGSVLVTVAEGTWQWIPPALAAGRDSLAEVLDRLGATAAGSPEDLITGLAASYRVSSCGDAASERTTVEAVGIERESAERLRIRLAVREPCDDAVAGFDEDLTLVRSAEGTWGVVEAQRRALCRRGVAGDLCV